MAIKEPVQTASTRQRALYFIILESSLLIPALFFAACFLYVAFSSMGYPFFLEWMEGQSMDVIQHIRDGKPFYTKPSLEYVPFIYTPYFFYLSAFVSLFTGVDFLAPRLVATMSTIGCSVMLFLWVRKEKGCVAVALSAACLFLMTYRMSGRWFDMSRVDTLFLFLTMIGLYLAVHHRSTITAIVSAMVLVFAFFTKQTALVLVGPVLLALLFTDMRRAMLIGVLFLLLTALSLAVLHITSDGWSSFYMFTLPAGHSIAHHFKVGFWTNNIFGKVGILFLISVGAVLFLLIKDWRKGIIYLAMAFSFVGAAYASRLHSGGWLNVLMPMHLFVALGTGIALAICRNTHKAFIVFPLIAALVMLEMATALYDPRSLIPTKKMEEQGNRFLKVIRAYEGEILMPSIQFIQTRVGKKSYSLGMAAHDIIRADLGDQNHIKKEFVKELRQAIGNKRFSVIVPGHFFWMRGINKHYYKVGSIPYHRYVTGGIRRTPTKFYLPRPAKP